MINLKRTYPAPASLEKEKNKKSGTYNQEDVVELLEHDFKNKCYLCGTKSNSFEIEHLKSHKGNLDLKFDWDNLFLSCKHCNNTKGDRFDNILNCMNEDVEDCISCELEAFPKATVKIKPLKDDIRVNNTVKLLDLCFNGETPLKKLDSKNMRDNLSSQLTEFKRTIIDFLNSSDETHDVLERKIIDELADTSEYAAFKRCYIKNNPKLNSIFGKYIPKRK